jgi:putative membrane protein
MKLQSIVLLFIGASYFTACGDANNAKNDSNTNKDTTVDNAMRSDTGSTSNITNNSTTAIVMLDTMDQNFALKAASGSMAEIEMANLAMQNSSNERVKAFASMMIRDHGKATDELKAMAPNKGLTLPTQPMPEHMKHIDMIKGKTGGAFDKVYMNHMVMDHQEDVSEFQKASTSVKDADLKAFASRNLPVLKTHLDSAKAISKMKM